MDIRLLEREIEAYRARWHDGDPWAINDFKEAFGGPFRRFVRRRLRSPHSPCGGRGSAKSSMATAACRDEDRLAAAVHSLARTLLSGRDVQALACETALNDQLTTRAFPVGSAEKQLY